MRVFEKFHLTCTSSGSYCRRCSKQTREKSIKEDTGDTGERQRIPRAMVEYVALPDWNRKTEEIDKDLEVSVCNIL
jgi:hypothetical protein